VPGEPLVSVAESEAEVDAELARVVGEVHQFKLSPAASNLAARRKSLPDHGRQ
jgi:hypothetical protein